MLKFVLFLAVVAGLLWVLFHVDDLTRKYIYPVYYSGYVEKYSERCGIDEYLVYAVIKTESGFDEKAVSNVGARGLMQLMEDAYDWVKFRMENDGQYVNADIFSEITYDDMYTAEYNIEYGTYLIMLLYEEYGDERTALAAYHSGRGNVNGWLTDKKYSSDGKTLDNIPSSQTSHYVDKVMTAYTAYTNLYKN